MQCDDRYDERDLQLIDVMKQLLPRFLNRKEEEEEEEEGNGYIYVCLFVCFAC